jgi:hypothetical protein
MKKQISIIIALVIILIATQACSVGGKAPSTEVEQEPTLATEQEPTIVSEPTSPAATTVPSQEAGSNDGPSGPETIDLTNPALYITSSAPAYTFDATMKFSGVDTTGAAKEVSLSMTEETQTLPQNTQRFLVVVTGGKGSAETVMIGDQGYSVFQEACFPFSASSAEGKNASEGMPNLQGEITGQAQRVESGIDVNGFVTDKYELTSQNMVADDELISAFVYVARTNGFITLFELQGRTKTDYQGLDSSQFTDIITAYNYFPVEDGSLIIAIPAICK